MAAIYSNFQQGTLTAGITNVATSLTDASFAALPTVASPDTVWLVFDPTGVAGNPEIVQVTTHTVSSNTITVTRAQQSTTARAHAAGIVWALAWTKSDADLLPSRLMTATGDILYASGVNTPAKLAIGTTGYPLTSSGTLPQWSQLGTAGIADGAVTSAKILDGTIVDADVSASAAIGITKISTTYSSSWFPSFCAYLSGANGTATSATNIVYNSTLFNNGSGYSTSNGRFTCPSGQAGIYAFNMNAAVYSIGTTGYWYPLLIQYNSSGTSITRLKGTMTPAQNGDTLGSVSAILSMAVGDYVVAQWILPATGTYSAGLDWNTFQGARVQ